MAEEFKVTGEVGKEQIVLSNVTFRMLQEIRKRDTLLSERESEIGDIKLYDFLPEKLIIALLINARYRYENNIEPTTLQKYLREETGDLGRMYIADLLTRISNSINRPLEEPFKDVSNLALEEMFEDSVFEPEDTPKIIMKTHDQK